MSIQKHWKIRLTYLCHNLLQYYSHNLSKTCLCLVSYVHSLSKTCYLPSACQQRWRQLQGGEMFCASLIAGSRRAFLCVDRVRPWLFVTERVLAETEWNAQGVNVCFSKSLFTFVCGFCSSSLENSFGLGTTDVKAKTDHSVSLRWNKKFWAFPKRRVLIVHSIYLWVEPGCLYSVYVVNTFSHAQIYSLCRTSFILLFSERTICAP